MNAPAIQASNISTELVKKHYNTGLSSQALTDPLLLELSLSPRSILGLGSAAVSRGRGGWVWQKECVCAHACTRAQLTQSEKCCMATVHKGTRLCIRMCQTCSCLYVWKSSKIKRLCVSACACVPFAYMSVSVFLYLSAPPSLCTETGFYITPYICAHTQCLCSREEAWTHCVPHRYCNNSSSHQLR